MKYYKNSCSFDTFSKAEVEAAFDYSLSITPEKMKPNVLAAKVMYFVHTNDLKQAQLEFEQATSNLDPSEWLELNKVEKYLWSSRSKSSSSSIDLYVLWVLSAFIISSLKNQFESKDRLM